MVSTYQNRSARDGSGLSAAARLGVTGTVRERQITVAAISRCQSSCQEDEGVGFELVCVVMMISLGFATLLPRPVTCAVVARAVLYMTRLMCDL